MNSTSNYRREFRPALSSALKTSLLMICGYSIVGTVLSMSAGVALSAGPVPEDCQGHASHRDGHTPLAGESPSTETWVTRPAKEPPRYRALEKDGVKGGEIVFKVPGTPKDVLAMILDFDHDADNRPWRVGSKLLSQQGDRYRVEAKYQGRVGINPTVVLVHEVEAKGEGFLIRFFIEKSAFGLKKLDGEYEIRPFGKDYSQVREHVFIHSDLPLVNASAKDLQDGLTEDATMIQKWMARRLAVSSPQKEVDDSKKVTTFRKDTDRFGVDKSTLSPKEEYRVLAGERAVPWDYGASAYRVRLFGRNAKKPFSPIDPYSQDDNISSGRPVAAKDFFSIANFIFPNTGSYWEVGGFQVRFGFEDTIRGHDPWHR